MDKWLQIPIIRNNHIFGLINIHLYDNNQNRFNRSSIFKFGQKLDAYLGQVDGEEHKFYHQFNQVDALKNVVVGFEGEVAVACGAFKPQSDDTVEVKRMWTEDSFRGRA